MRMCFKYRRMLDLPRRKRGPQARRNTKQANKGGVLFGGAQ